MITWKFCTNFSLSILCQVCVCRISYVRKSFSIGYIIYHAKFYYIVSDPPALLWFNHIKHVNFNTFILEVELCISVWRICACVFHERIKQKYCQILILSKTIQKQEGSLHLIISFYTTISNLYSSLQLCVD